MKNKFKMKNNFTKRKQDILSKIDKSSKQSWDKRIVPLCIRINNLEDFYTTSSCSGRIVIMVDQPKKEFNLFLRSYHELITFKELKKDLKEIASLGSDIDRKVVNKKSSVNRVQRRSPTKSASKFSMSERQRANCLIKFKQEPCILHVATNTLENAQDFYDKARLTGWKKHGIIASKRRFVVEINGTDKLEFPIIDNGKILVNDDFLKLIVKKSNQNMKKSWQSIDKLKKKL